MKNKLKIFVIACVVLFFSAGCVGTKTTRLMDWQNLHRVGPGTVARVYYWEAETQKWMLTDEKYEIPEGHYVGPPPSVDDEK